MFTDIIEQGTYDLIRIKGINEPDDAIKGGLSSLKEIRNSRNNCQRNEQHNPEPLLFRTGINASIPVIPWFKHTYYLILNTSYYS